MEEKLTKFLKQKKLYSKFMRNMKADGEYDSITELIAGVEKANKGLGWDTTPFSAAFVWNATIEGRSFWLNIEREWQYFNQTNVITKTEP